jgi:hypothetical protein
MNDRKRLAISRAKKDRLRIGGAELAARNAEVKRRDVIPLSKFNFNGWGGLRVCQCGKAGEVRGKRKGDA